MTTPFCTVDEVKSMLPIRSGNADYDDRISMFIAMASTQIEQATNRRFTYQNYVHQFRTMPTVRVYYDLLSPTNEWGTYRNAKRMRYPLEGYPIDQTQPFLVWYDPMLLFSDDTQLNPTSIDWNNYGDYVVDYEQQILTVHVEMREEPNALKVSYWAGYKPDSTETLSSSIPADLKLACMIQTVHLFNRLNPDNIGMDTDRSQGKVPSGRFLSHRGLTPEVAAIVAPYKAIACGIG